MNICYFGTFEPTYQRNRIIRKGLEKNSHEVILCNTQYSGFMKVYVKLFFKWLKLNKNIDVIIVGETGFVLMPLAKMIGLLWGKPVILDAFFSVYQMNVYDRKLIPENSFAAKKMYLIEKIGCLLADAIILDTFAHIDYFKRTFFLYHKKFLRILVGADSEVFDCKKYQHQVREKCFTVLFWGTFIPLHGIEYIVKAAKRLENQKDIVFKIIGMGQTYQEIVTIINELDIKNIELIGTVDEGILPGLIAKSDICLGIFNNSDKARNVLPHKVYQALAMKKPVITAETRAAAEVLKNGETAVFCEIANDESLAYEIMYLKNSPELRNKIGEKGYTLYIETLTPEKVVKPFCEYVKARWL
ncbi:MAG: hypothetical protein A2252_10705 [Elusimicrobia bacterium RIFOXYA2_FULL_39_19]|nr:MAG: hypothetical protein A2252_10705 [Elusimicrobia bacterium RIFOXYA2_FULL_39_19]